MPHMTKPSRTKRWPGWVYDEGTEPDYRFSFANERTFLAWIRTALALLAAGVALDVVDLSMAEGVQEFIGILLVALGLVAAVVAWLRWAWSERAMRRRDPLPAVGAGVLFTVVLVTIGVVIMIVGV